MMSFEIKEAAPEDVSPLIALIREFAAYENLSDYCEVTEEKLRAALFGKTKIAEAIIVFESETGDAAAAAAAVGYAIFYSNFASFRGQRGIYLEDIFIKPEHRGRGIGEMMLKHIARYARSRGFERIDFQVLEWNAPAVRFYEKLGARRNDQERHFKFDGDAFDNLAS